MKDKMISAFKHAEGGLFRSVEKADVGSSYQEMEKQGISLMGWADPFMPDKSLPEHVEKAWIDAIKDQSSPHYTAPIGSMDLKKKIADKLKRINKIEVDPERNILITPGSDSGLFFAILPFISAGDEVIIPSPSYPNNFLSVEIMGGKVVPVELNADNGYQLDISKMEEVISEKTKMVIITHPNNPTTTVYNRESLEKLQKFLIKYDLILVCDQAFEDFTYENEMITPASLPGLFERTISVFSFSKGMGFSGLRVGYIVCPDTIMDSLFANAVGVVGATSTSAQKAIIAAMEHPEFMQEFRDAFDYRRHKAYEILNTIPNVRTDLPESGFLCWVDVSKIGESSEIVSYLVERARVSVNDGLNYGPGGAGHLRIVLGVYKENEKVVDALKRIKTALIEFQK